MTIKELYEEAVKQGKENWNIAVYDWDGCTRTADEIEWDEDRREAFIS